MKRGRDTEEDEEDSRSFASSDDDDDYDTDDESDCDDADNGNVAREVSPVDLLRDLLGGAENAARLAARIRKSYFRQPSAAEVDAYTISLASAVQTCDLAALAASNLTARNRFGVTLLHKACRYPNWETARYLQRREPSLAFAEDDLGRIALHDACWNESCDFGVVEMLCELDVAALLTGDNRGHTPLCYVPKMAWGAWKSWLTRHAHALRRAFKADVDDVDVASARDSSEHAPIFESHRSSTTYSPNLSTSASTPAAVTRGSFPQSCHPSFDSLMTMTADEKDAYEDNSDLASDASFFKSSCVGLISDDESDGGNYQWTTKSSRLLRAHLPSALRPHLPPGPPLDSVLLDL